ncbi:hypothetical protein MLD38_024575 [Melastoma candidum]|uniref:Uncharacterized protein n=1 Tax=Melastoma candidum TaxID=119954 RepID=A0ACB9NSF4_9MYRT|nr:hypothetical protein MLD38_024575 [Melastoma candidum]
MLTREQLLFLFRSLLFPHFPTRSGPQISRLTVSLYSSVFDYGWLLLLFVSSHSDVKKRIADGVQDKQEAVAVTTAIQEDIFREMGIGYGISRICNQLCNFWKWNLLLLLHSNKLDAHIPSSGVREEVACDEAELNPSEFSEKKLHWEKFQEQQLEKLTEMRRYNLDDQSVILYKLRQQMEDGNFDDMTSLLPSEQMQEIVRRRVSTLFKPRT